jgi:hypothetical protein
VIRLYVLDVPEFKAVADALALAAQRTRTVGDYCEFSSDADIVVDRKAAGARTAVWFSAIGALTGGEVTRFDRTELRVEPVARPRTSEPVGAASAPHVTHDTIGSQ